MHEEGCWVENAWRGNNYAETRTQPNTPYMPRMFIPFVPFYFTYCATLLRFVRPLLGTCPSRSSSPTCSSYRWNDPCITRAPWCLACWQKDEQSSRKKIEWKNIDSGRPRRSKEPRGGASALIIFNIIQRYKINQLSPQWTGRVQNTAAQCSYIILVHG